MNGQAFIYIDKFGFYDGGEASLNVTLDLSTYEALIFGCNQYAWREVFINKKQTKKTDFLIIYLVICRLC